MDGELQQYACAVGDPCLGVVLPLLTVVSTKADKGAGVLFSSDAGLHHSDCRYRDVPVHHAVQHHDERQPDHVGCDLQPADAEPDDLRGDCLRADYSGYTSWCYWKMFGRITREDIEKNTHSLY
jgi:cytochrome d ubiquinol oxidase subunit II